MTNKTITRLKANDMRLQSIGYVTDLSNQLHYTLLFLLKQKKSSLENLKMQPVPNIVNLF